MQIAIYSYLSLPILIFFAGWMKFYFSLPLCGFVIAALYRAINHPEPKTKSKIKAPEVPAFRIRDNLWICAAAFGIIFFWVLISGIGKFTFQNGDHTTRNGLFELLVNNKWPIVIDSPHYDKPVGLIYYIGFWMPSAVIGKCFGMTAGYFSQVLWASIGIFLFYYIVSAKFVKKAALWPLAIIVFFSGLDIFGKFLMGEDILSILSDNTSHIEWWAGTSTMQYSSFTTQLFWVFNQAVPIWLCTVTIIAQKNSREIVLLFALTMLNGVLPAMGVAVLILFVVGNKLVLALKKKPYAPSLKSFMAEHFTFENYVGAVVALVFVMYYMGNFVSQNGGFRTWSSFGGVLVMVLVFFAVEAGFYIAAVAPFHKKNFLFYYVIVVLLCICPWYVLGIYNDFCMRVSIPALVVLLCLVVDTLIKAKEQNKRRLVAVIICLLIIGGLTPINEIVRSVSNTVITEQSKQPQGIYSLNPIDVDFIRDQFYGYSDSFFFKYLAK